ncbi:MAG: hypothetical protein FWG02_10250 [Holophagaceae bacterium]|nr:hypothetical protein [Holophagaceae bacterium]
MESWFASLSAAERFFLICAVIGSLGVLLRLVIQVFGFAGGDLDGDVGDVESHHTSADGFKIISIHGLSAFLMMFGLVGFALRRENHTSVFVSVLLGTTAGVFSVWIIARLFRVAIKLQSVGNLDINKAIGCPGMVYLQIPKSGEGRVVVNIGGRQREIDAVAVDGEEIVTGTPIVVVTINESIAVVEPARPKQN